MARIFNHPSGIDYLGSTGGTRPWWSANGTIFALMNTFWASGDSAGHMVIYIKNTAGTNNFTYVKHTDNNLYVGWTTGGVDARIVSSDAGLFTAFTALHTHIVDWDDTANLQHLYLDNVLVGTSTAAFTVPVGNADSYVLGSTGSATPWGGAIAELARWNRVLTAAERAVLEATRCPLFVPDGLVAYLPIIGRYSPEIELIGGENLTVNGSPPAAGHARVRYPASPFVSSLAAAPVSIPSIGPPLVTNAFQVFAPAVTIEGALVAPVVSNPFQIFAPSLTFTGEQTVEVPLLSSAFTVYAPAVNVSESTIQEDARELEPHNLKVRIVDFVGGDDLRITRTYTELQGGILISKAYLTIKRHAKDDNDAEAIIQKTITSSMQMSGEITDNDTTGGSVALYFDLSKDDTALLTPLIPYHYDVQVITIGNAVYTCEKGVIVMQQGVTHSDS